MRSTLLGLLLLLGGAARLAAQLPPDAPWQTFHTANFRVHFTPGLEPAARRAAYHAENARRELHAGFVEAPRRRIDLVVSDNVDFANGYATPFPSNRIVVFAHPPTDELSLSFFDDWLELVVAHELVHIFHLDHAGGVWRVLRRVFGRSPLLFPQALYSPDWVTEGLATFWESRLTEAGRVRGTFFDMALRTAVLEGEFFPIDRVTGGPTRWPGGSAAYIYGAHFINHLAERHGPEQVSRYVRELGRQLLPYQANREARDAFGVSFSRAWRTWQDSLRRDFRAQADAIRTAGLSEPQVLTREGRSAAFPRYAPDSIRIVYAASTGREPTQTRVITPGAGERTLGERNSVGPSTGLPGGALLLSQLERRDPYRVYEDLYQVAPDGEIRRLTRGSRISEPDANPDGRHVVAVQNAGATNALVRVDLGTGAIRTLAAPSLETHWALPRWSPDGTRIAAARWRQGGFFDVVVLDSAGRVLREITRDRAVDNAPAWSPDGRYVVWSSDRTGIPNLFAHDLQTGRTWQVSNVLSGAFQPDVSPDGRWIAFSYYRADGFHIARIRWDPANWRPAPTPKGEWAAPAGSIPRIGGPVRPYGAWRSLAPGGWTPVLVGDSTLGVGLGAAVFGEDVVERHAYFATGLIYSERGRLEGLADYQFRGLGNPILNLGAYQQWSVRAPGVVQRERSLSLAAAATRPRFRRSASLVAGVELENRDYLPAERGDTLPSVWSDLPPDASAFLGASFSTARAFAFSISPESGWGASATASGHRYTRAPAGQTDPSGYLEFVGRGRAFPAFEAWGFARHVVALRATGAVRTGSRAPVFVAGGTGGELASPLDVGSAGSDASFPIRGYREGVQYGDRAFVGSAEYRFPVALPERGFRLVPLFLDRIWGDVWTDVGGAFCQSACPQRPNPAVPTNLTPLVSVGAELGLSFGVGYHGGLPLRVGFAVPLSMVPATGGDIRPKPGFYVAAGRSF